MLMLLQCVLKPGEKDFAVTHLRSLNALFIFNEQVLTRPVLCHVDLEPASVLSLEKPLRL